MQRGFHMRSTLRDSDEVLDRIPQDVYQRLHRHGFSRDQMAEAFEVPRTWIEAAAELYCGIGDSYTVSSAEEKASKESLALAPMVADAVKKFRERQLAELRDESESATAGRIHRRYMETEVKTYTLVDSRGRAIGW